MFIFYIYVSTEVLARAYMEETAEERALTMATQHGYYVTYR